MSKIVEIFIPVEKNVPRVPRRTNTAAAGYTSTRTAVIRRRYPWDDLEVGDSFLVPEMLMTEAQKKNACGQVFSSVIAAARHRGVEVECRRVDDGVRVWRTA